MLKLVQLEPGQRLKEARKYLGLSMRAFAEPLGMSGQAVNHWERLEAPIDRMVAEAIEKLHGISADWLLTGEGKTFVGVKTDDDVGGSVSIPLLSLRHAGQDFDSVDSLSFQEAWLKGRIGVDLEHLFLTKMDGDSMAPTLSPGDLVMVDRSAAAKGFMDGLWVFNFRDVVHVKRLQQTSTGGFQAKGDNGAYKAITLKELPQLIGKVVWSDKRW